MKEENINNKKPQLDESEAKSSVELQVGLTPLQLNEIYNGDSFKLIERVPAKTVDLILEDMPYNTTQNVWRLGGRFNAAKPLLYEVPTYLR